VHGKGNTQRPVPIPHSSGQPKKGAATDVRAEYQCGSIIYLLIPKADAHRNVRYRGAPSAGVGQNRIVENSLQSSHAIRITITTGELRLSYWPFLNNC
jgi:hypothetical protein